LLVFAPKKNTKGISSHSPPESQPLGALMLTALDGWLHIKQNFQVGRALVCSYQG